MKDFTTTSFGLIIAYLLPGLVTLFGISAWSQNLRKMFSTLFGAQANGSLLVAIGGCALVVGLVLNVFRWLIFEKIICRKYKVAPGVFSQSSTAQQLQSFLMIIEETFRYHQFYGGLTILMPFLYLSWLRYFETALFRDSMFLTLTFLFTLGQLLLCWFLYEVACGAAEAPWIAAAGRLRNMRTVVHALQVVVASLYLLTLKIHFGDLGGRFALVAVAFVFTFGAISVGANAIAALRRYSDRANNLVGGQI